MEKKDIVSYNYDELQDEIKSIGEKPFRAKQIYAWLHEKLAEEFDEMTNLSKALREKLDQAYEIRKVKVVAHQISKVDPTEKFLFELEDGNRIESVLMKYNYGNSVCISSQVGCRMGCRFCASTLDGLERNLTTSEMLRQIYQIQKMTGERVSNVVVMGTGEPLDNYDNFVKFIHMLSDEHGLNISQRSITASTCGIVPNIHRLAGEGLQITLALSLHGSSQEKRKKLMPIANKYELSEVLEACDDYYKQTGRRVTFEYSLVAGVNDGPDDVKELTGILKHRNCHLNLIPVNPIKERDFKKPDSKKTNINIIQNIYKYIQEREKEDYLKMCICDKNNIIFGGIMKMLKEVKNVNVMEVAHMARKLIANGTDYVPVEYYITEIMNQNADKWNAVKFLADKFNIKESEIITIGDNVNDEQMLKNAGLGVAMGNSAPYIQKMAKEVTLDNNSGGVAHIVEKYILN